MGKSAPRAPDPYATAQAQTTQNIETARTQARLNRGDTFTPFGSVTNRDLGEEWMQSQLAARRAAGTPSPTTRMEPIPGTTYNEDGSLVPSGQFRQVTVPGAAFDEAAARRELEAQNPYADMWRTDVRLSPEQQRLYQQGVDLSTQTNDLALSAIPRAQRILSTDVDMAGLPSWQSDYGAGTDLEANKLRTQESLLSRMEPAFQRDREALEGRLLAQGFVPGSEAYARAADELSRARTDARYQAYLAAGQEQSRLLGEARQAAGFSNASREAQLRERLMLRTQPVNEIAALFGLGPGMQMPGAVQQQPVGVNPADLQGGIYGTYNSQVQQTGANNAAMAGAGGATLAAIITAI